MGGGGGEHDIQSAVQVGWRLVTGPPAVPITALAVHSQVWQYLYSSMHVIIYTGGLEAVNVPRAVKGQGGMSVQGKLIISFILFLFLYATSFRVCSIITENCIYK